MISEWRSRAVQYKSNKIDTKGIRIQTHDLEDPVYHVDY